MVDVKRWLRSKSAGGRLDMAIGGNPGILSSVEASLNSVGFDATTGKNAMREKNSTEVVETTYIGSWRSLAIGAVLASREKSTNIAEKGGDDEDNRGPRRWID